MFFSRQLHIENSWARIVIYFYMIEIRFSTLYLSNKKLQFSVESLLLVKRTYLCSLIVAVLNASILNTFQNSFFSNLPSSFYLKGINCIFGPYMQSCAYHISIFITVLSVYLPLSRINTIHCHSFLLYYFFWAILMWLNWFSPTIKDVFNKLKYHN